MEKRIYKVTDPELKKIFGDKVEAIETNDADGGTNYVADGYFYQPISRQRSCGGCTLVGFCTFCAYRPNRINFNSK